MSEQREVPRITGLKFGPGQAVVLVVVENREACTEIDIGDMSDSVLKETLELSATKAIQAIMKFRREQIEGRP